MKHIFNFIKFSIIITVLEFLNEFLRYNLELFSFNTNAIIRYSLLAVILIFIAFNRKYIVFRKDDWKQNIISIIFIICSLLWFCIMFYISIILSLELIIYYYGF